MFPYHDENQTERTAIVTLAIIAACVVAWLIVQGAGAEVPLAQSVCNLGLIPGELTASLPAGTSFEMGRDADGRVLACVTESGHQYATILTHMFLHGSWM